MTRRDPWPDRENLEPDTFYGEGCLVWAGVLFVALGFWVLVFVALRAVWPW